MRPLSSSHLVIAAALTVLTTRNDAQVTLTTPSQSSFICGKVQILICEIDAYANIMTWTKNTFANPLASCSPLECSVNPSMNASYNFIFDTDNGIFHMEILTVKVADNRTSYSCANGFESDTVTSNVAVENNCSIVKESMAMDSDTTKVSATTGCIRDNALGGVHFEWRYHAVNGSETKKYESQSNTNYENSTCLSDPDCGVSGFSSVTNSINITNDENGKNFTLSVSVTCGGSIIETDYDDLIFTLNFPEPSTCIHECGIEIPIAYCIIILVVLQMCIYDVYQYYSFLKRKYERCLSEMDRSAILKHRHLEDEHSRLVKHFLADLKALHLPAESSHTERQHAANSSESHLEKVSFHLVMKFATDLKALSLKEDEYSSLENQLLADLKALHLTDKRFNLEMEFAAELKNLHLKDYRSRLEMHHAMALKKPPVRAKFGITSFLCSVPFIGLVVKGLLVYNKRESDHLQCRLVSVVVLSLVSSLFCEIGMILLCAVCCVCQWYALILLFPELILRWILCIMIAVLYYRDDNDMPTPSTWRIVLSCTPIFGLIYSFQQCIVNILQARNIRVSQTPDERMGRTSQNENCDRETIQKEIPNLREPRPLPKLPKIESISKLQDIEAVMKQHSRLPHIGLSERTRLESKSTKL